MVKGTLEWTRHAVRPGVDVMQRSNRQPSTFSSCFTFRSPVLLLALDMF